MISRIIPAAMTCLSKGRKIEPRLYGLKRPERAVKVLELLPDLYNRELGKLSGMAAATAKKHRQRL